MTTTRLSGNILTSHQTGDHVGNTSASSVKRAENPTNGCQSSLPEQYTQGEKIYMHQPEGFDDGTGRVCELIKTLYGLKQSGCEWNKELDEKLRK
jgi:hypothetical protein